MTLGTYALWPRPVAVALVAIAVGAPAATAAVRSPLTPAQRHSMAALRDLSVQRVVLLRTLRETAPVARRRAIGALAAPLITTLRATALAGALLAEPSLPTPGRGPRRHEDLSVPGPVTDMCADLAAGSCVPLADAAAAYVDATNRTAIFATDLLTYVDSGKGRGRTALRRSVQAVARSVAANRRAGVRLAALVPGAAQVRPTRARIELRIRALLRDPWLAVSEQRAAALGLTRDSLRALIRRAIPAARSAAGKTTLMALLEADYHRIQAGAAAVSRQVADPAPCTSQTDCHGAKFSGGHCDAASGRAGAAVNMHGAILDGCDLSGLDLGKWDLSSASLVQATLKGATVRSAPLANLAYADLTGATLKSADLRGANLGSAKLVDAVMQASNMSSYDGRTATNLGNADATRADMRYSYLNGARGLDSTILVNANLAGTDLSGTALTLPALDQDVDRLKGLNACGATVLYPQYRAFSLYPTGNLRCPIVRPPA